MSTIATNHRLFNLRIKILMLSLSGKCAPSAYWKWPNNGKHKWFIELTKMYIVKSAKTKAQRLTS